MRSKYPHETRDVPALCMLYVASCSPWYDFPDYPEFSMKTENDTQVRDSFVPRFIWFIFSPETKKWLTKLIASRPLKTLLGRRRFHRSASLFLFSSVLLICCFGAIEHAHMHSCGVSSGASGKGCSVVSLSTWGETQLRSVFPSPTFSGNQPT